MFRFKINGSAFLPQGGKGLHKITGISSKPGDGFAKNPLHLPFPAVPEQPAEPHPFLLGGGRHPIIGIDSHRLPLRVLGKQPGKVFFLPLVRVLLPPGIGRHPDVNRYPQRAVFRHLLRIRRERMPQQRRKQSAFCCGGKDRLLFHDILTPFYRFGQCVCPKSIFYPPESHFQAQMFFPKIKKGPCRNRVLESFDRKKPNRLSISCSPIAA